MAHIVAIRNGMSASDEKDLSNIAVAFMSSGGGVVGGGDYLVAAQSSPNNTVQVATGRAYVPTSDGSMVYSTHLDASQNVTIGANSSGNPRIDVVVLYIDLAVSPDAAADNVAKFFDVQGTPAASPVAPDNAAILTAIGSSNPYIILAQIAVANGFSSINSGNITDERTFAKISGGDTTFQSSFSNYVQSGLNPTVPGSSLTMTIPSGVIYIAGVKIAVNSDGGHTYTASQDTYVDVTSGGAFVYQGVSNGSAAPSLTANSIRIAKVVSNGTQITSIAQGGFDSNSVQIYPKHPAPNLLMDYSFKSEFQNFIQSGLTIPTSASLAATSVAGVVYWKGLYLSVVSDGGHTYTASNDCYVDVNPETGVYTYNTVSNGAAAPAITSSSIRIAKVVTNGTAVTNVYQDGSLDSVGNVIYPASPRLLGTKYYTPSAAGTATLDFTNYAKRHIIQMPAGNITIALPSGVVPTPFIIEIIQDSVGSRTVTWFTTIDWAGGSAPTLTTTASKKDSFGFMTRITGTYDGYIIGQNV